jgi:hypothetical protein
MPTAPITIPSPGQSTRSAASFVSTVIVAPQAGWIAVVVCATAPPPPTKGK